VPAGTSFVLVRARRWLVLAHCPLFVLSGALFMLRRPFFVLMVAVLNTVSVYTTTDLLTFIYDSLHSNNLVIPKKNNIVSLQLYEGDLLCVLLCMLEE